MWSASGFLGTVWQRICAMSNDEGSRKSFVCNSRVNCWQECAIFDALVFGGTHCDVVASPEKKKARKMSAIDW
jgi:hypothetical protein